MFLESMVLDSTFIEALVPAGIGAFIVAFAFIAFLILAGFYVYKSLALMTIAKKLKYKYPWLAWIPFADGVLVLQLGKFHWAWIFLILIPIFGWIALFIMTAICFWRIFEKRKYPAWLSLLFVLSIIPNIGGLFMIAFLVLLGFVAWKDN